jgi:hypothetical protein
MGAVTENDRISNLLCDEFYVMHRLFRQYRELKRIAYSHGVNIYNATAGGALDEFDRVPLEDVLKESCSPC